MTTEQAKATAELLGCGLSYEARVKDLRAGPSEYTECASAPFYRLGYKHARYDAAEIANEADAEIKALREGNARLREAVEAGRIATQELRDCIHTSCVNPHDGVVDDDEARNDIATLDARLELIDAALAPTDSEGAGQ